MSVLGVCNKCHKGYIDFIDMVWWEKYNIHARPDNQSRPSPVIPGQTAAGGSIPMIDCQKKPYR